MKAKNYLIVLMCCACIPNAFATTGLGQNAVDYNPDGFYVDVNAGPAMGSLQVPLPYISASEIKGVVANFNLGYQFNHYFALETGYTHYNYEITDNTLGSRTVTLGLFDIAAKGMLPITQRANLFAKLGAQIGFDGSISRPVGAFPYASIGLSYALTSQLAVNVQASGVIAGLGGIGSVTGGITYHFG